MGEGERCPVCQRRKARRACPAKGAFICSHCCGTKRLVEIACPPDCVYLKGEHAPAWEGRETERRRDARRLAPHASGLSRAQEELLFGVLVALHHLRRPESTDALVLEAVATVRKTVATREKGILYEHPPSDLRASPLVAALKEALGAVEKPPSDSDLLPVLSALEDALKAAMGEGLGKTTFLDTVFRLVGHYSPSPAKKPLIVAP